MAKKKAAKKSSKKGIAIAAAALVAVGAFIPSEEEEVPEIVAGTEVVIQDEPSTPVEDEIIIEEDTEATPEPPKAPVSKPVQKPSSSYVASDDSDRYHYPSCRWAKEINQENLISFSSVDEAKAAGYVSCGSCNPK